MTGVKSTVKRMVWGDQVFRQLTPPRICGVFRDIRVILKRLIFNANRARLCPIVGEGEGHDRGPQPTQFTGSPASVAFTASRSSSGVNGLGKNRSGFTEKHHP